VMMYLILLLLGVFIFGAAVGGYLRDSYWISEPLYIRKYCRGDLYIVTKQE